MAGYSGTPLASKLGIKEGSAFTIRHAPSDFSLDLPSGVTTKHRAQGRSDVVLAFFTKVVRVQEQADARAA